MLKTKTEMDNKWTTFTKRIPVKTDIKTVYKAWATQAGLEKWFLRSAVFIDVAQLQRSPKEHIQKGDNYTWLWYGYDDDSFEKNFVLDANDMDFLQFGFSGGSIVSVNIKKEGGETIVELTQHNIPIEENPRASLYVACSEGWVFYLTNLKSVLEGGPDLRNKNPNIKKVINS